MKFEFIKVNPEPGGNPKAYATDRCEAIINVQKSYLQEFAMRKAF